MTMRPSVVRWTIGPLFLWVLYSRGYVAVHASTSVLDSSASSSADNNLSDDSWFEAYSYLFSRYAGCFEVRGRPEYISDGDCDDENNNDGCDYDGGDCCICTCADAEYTCGKNPYDCLDPDVSDNCRDSSNAYDPYEPRYDSSDFPDCERLGGSVEDIGNGWCSIYNSIEECGYDGGDCCSCTCVDTEDSVCGSNGGYYCQDPTVSAECKEESDSYIPYDSLTIGYRYSQHPGCFEAGGSPIGVANGRCEYYNNIKECEYDGGDCCICTCEDAGEKRCGEYPGYYCEDPAVSEECRTASLSWYSSSYTEVFNDYPECLQTGVIPFFVGDGTCDYDSNFEECGYDGGDCCSCTCEDTEYGTCAESDFFYCRDPNVPAECVEESRMSYPSSFESWDAFSQYYLCHEMTGLPWNIGDGKCDAYNNIDECGYDGGDCCICTCVDTAPGTCGGSGGYFCQDPSVSAECVEESTAYIPPSSSAYFENFNEYSDCYEAGGSPTRIGDGTCDFWNSIEECGYDGGDCCKCTCQSTEYNPCGQETGYYCQDPSVSEACKVESDSYIPLVPSTYLYRFSQYRGCFEVGGYAEHIGDGYCEESNNNEECAYDGGDCCSCTCVDREFTKCDDSRYDCQDPTVSSKCVLASRAHTVEFST